MRAGDAPGVPSRVGAIALAAALCAFPAAAAEEEGRRGSVPPGTSQDGSRPAEGAIQGGSVERKRKDREGERAAEPTTREELARCRDLTGTLRAQCLADAREAPSSPAPKE